MVSRLFFSVMVPPLKSAAAFTVRLMRALASGLMALPVASESMTRRRLPLLSTFLSNFSTPTPSARVGSPSSDRPVLN